MTYISTSFLFAAAYFYLPGGLANIGANLGKYAPFIKRLDYPIDSGKYFRGRRIIGQHKLWSGFLFGIIVGMISGMIKYLFLDTVFSDFKILNLSFLENFLLSFLLSCGAVTGDLIKSFVKRQLGIAVHSPWIPFDEIDHTTVSLLLTKLFFNISWKLILTAILVVAVLHFISNLIAYLFHIKKVPY